MVPPLDIRASAAPRMWAGGLPRFAMRCTTWKRLLIARRMGAGKVPITVVEVPPLSQNAKDLQCKPELPCGCTVIRRSCLLPLTQHCCTAVWGYSRQAAHHITPLACCNHGRPACHSVGTDASASWQAVGAPVAGVCILCIRPAHGRRRALHMWYAPRACMFRMPACLAQVVACTHGIQSNDRAACTRHEPCDDNSCR